MDTLKPEHFQFLTFEGGGGKGAAYLGALAVLAEPEFGYFEPFQNAGKPDYRLNPARIKGVAGTSAGAITATLLASGTSLGELTMLVQNAELLSSFFDFATPGERPFATTAERSLYTRFVAPPVTSSQLVTHLSVIDAIVAAKKELMSLLIEWVAYDLGLLLANYIPTAAQRISANINGYVDCLINDFGFFSGVAIRHALDTIIAEKTYIADQPQFGCLFKEHINVHQMKLILIGTNLETGRSIAFSHDTTPMFRIIDALYISLAIPLFFKPLVITDDDARSLTDNPEFQHVLKGTWVDGGVLNNTPIHAFDEEDGSLRHDVLSLRLDIEARHPISSLSEYVRALTRALLGMSEEGQIHSASERTRTINLPVGELSTPEFKIPYFELYPVFESAAKVVLDRFGIKRNAGEAVQKLLPWFVIPKGSPNKPT